MHLSIRLAPVLALLVLGCGGRTTFTTIRHPLQVGAVDPNQVVFDQSREERRRGIPPGSLVDMAELVSVTPDQVCVRLTVWSDQLEPERSVLQAYRIALLTDESGVEQTSAQIQMGQPTVQAYQGVRRTTRLYGSGRVSSYSRSFVWQITTSPAQVCFPNGGFVTPSTSRITLEMANAGSGNRMSFEWDLVSAVAQ